MKPFDLELAKAGYPVCTRDGYPVELLYFNYRHPIQKFKIVGIIHYEDKDFSTIWTNEGKYSPTNLDTDWDLFLAPIKKSVWKNFYNLGGDIFCGDYTWKTEELAKKNINDDQCASFGHFNSPIRYLCTQKIEWEEP